MVAKQQAKREQTHPVYLHAVEKYKKVDMLIHKMIRKQQVKYEYIKRILVFYKKTCSVFCKSA